MRIRIPLDLDGAEIIAFSYLTMSRNPELGSVRYVSPRLIGLNMGLTSIRTPQYIKEALDELLQKKYISGEKIPNSNIYKFDVDSIDVQNNYVALPYAQIRKVIESGGRNAYTLVSFFVQMMATRDSKTYKGHYSLAKLGEINGCNLQTAINCTKKLEEIGVIQVIHNHRNDGTCNTYWLKGEDSKK